MKKFIFIILALLLISSGLSAKEKEVVNEYMNDIYFANGINTDRGEAQSALTDIIKKQVKESLFNGNEAKMKESVVAVALLLLLLFRRSVHLYLMLNYQIENLSQFIISMEAEDDFIRLFMMETVVLHQVAIY